MRKRNLIILILLLIIAISLAYIGISEYMHNQEEQKFYNGIKEISNIENKTDSKGTILHNQTNPSVADIKEYEIESINTTSVEITMLQDLKKEVSNKSYIEFIDIQINRLNSENKIYSSMLENSNVYEKYKNGEIGASRTISLINDKSKESDLYYNKTREYKVEADSFLSIHTDMKDKFEQLEIDEDFLYDQIEEVKATSIK